MSTEEFDLLKEMNSGEKALYNKCLKYVSDEFKMIPNAIFNRHDKGTNQIDLITISKKGIFVIEMKDYKGWIFGDENHINWTQSLNAGKGKSNQYKFRNPIKQNENHIKTLKKILLKKGYDNLPVYNVVVFGNDAVLKEVTKSIDVVNLKDIGKVFKKYRDLVITTEEIDSIYDFLYGEIIKEKNAIGEHIKYVNSLQSENSNIERNSRVNQDLANNHVFGGNKFSIKSLSGYVLKHKKITIIILIVILGLILENGLMLLGIIALGTLAIKFKDRRAMGLAVLMFFIFLSSNPLEDSSSNNIQGNNNSEIESVKDTSDQSDETDSNTLVEDLSEEDITVALTESVNKSQENNNQSNSKEIAEVEEAPIINSSDNQSVEQVESNNVSQEDTEIETNETINEVASLKEDEKMKIEETIFVGSPKSLVGELLGEPDRVVDNIWSYGIGHISYDSDGLVNGWNNYNNVLDIGLEKSISDAESIGVGSTKEEVLSALGSPSKIDPSAPNYWYYSIGHISYDSDGLVNGWNNYNNVLDVGLEKPKENAESINIGSTKAEVLSAIGSPTKIDSATPNYWYYSIGHISYDSEGLVNGWNNYNNVLDIGLEKPKENAEKVSIGSTKEDVLNILGSPTKIVPPNINTWYYKQAYINFDNNDLVESWRDAYNILSDKVSQ